MLLKVYRFETKDGMGMFIGNGEGTAATWALGSTHTISWHVTEFPDDGSVRHAFKDHRTFAMVLRMSGYKLKRFLEDGFVLRVYQINVRDGIYWQDDTQVIFHFKQAKPTHHVEIVNGKIIYKKFKQKG